MGDLSLTTLGSDSKPDEIFNTLDRDGGVIVEGLLSREQIGQLNTELDEWVDACEAGTRHGNEFIEVFYGRNTKRFCGLAARSNAFIDVMLHPTLERMGDHFLLPQCGSYWLNTSQMMVVGPGEPAQFLHRDMGNWPYLGWPSFEVTVSSIFALNDFSEENGATVVVPGSHRWEDAERQPEPHEVTQAVMSAGSVLLYLGNTIHGAGRNRSESVWRRGMHISFVLGWLRPEENSNIAVPLEVARELPRRAQQLLGYHSYHAAPSVLGGSLGLVDVRDASERMDPESASPFGSRSD